MPTVMNKLKDYLRWGLAEEIACLRFITLLGAANSDSQKEDTENNNQRITTALPLAYQSQNTHTTRYERIATALPCGRTSQ